jgi:hypothetical protein
LLFIKRLTYQSKNDTTSGRTRRNLVEEREDVAFSDDSRWTVRGAGAELTTEAANGPTASARSLGRAVAFVA